jgi:hypothetical protein
MGRAERNHDMTSNLFTTDRFSATPHSTAEEKARFCNDFARFVLGGFDRKRFTQKFYQRLSLIFGHIAHFNASGFWETWFSTPEQQRQFVQHIHEYVALGDPHYCWSDVERELKSWIVREATAIEAVLAENERKFAEAAKAESDRRSALVAMISQPFTVVAKSENIGNFGHRQYVLLADDGGAWKVQRIYLYPWEVGQVVNVPLLNGQPDWCAMQGVECPERLENCPVESLARFSVQRRKGKTSQAV